MPEVGDVWARSTGVEVWTGEEWLPLRDQQREIAEATREVVDTARDVAAAVRLGKAAIALRVGALQEALDDYDRWATNDARPGRAPTEATNLTPLLCRWLGHRKRVTITHDMAGARTMRRCARRGCDYREVRPL